MTYVSRIPGAVPPALVVVHGEDASRAGMEMPGAVYTHARFTP